MLDLTKMLRNLQKIISLKVLISLVMEVIKTGILKTGWKKDLKIIQSDITILENNLRRFIHKMHNLKKLSWTQKNLEWSSRNSRRESRKLTWLLQNLRIFGVSSLR